jgi:hypothetical protein
MYMKRERHDKEAKSANNDEEQFANQFFNFMRKHPDIIISHVFVPQVNLDLSTRFTLSSVGSALSNQKYQMDDIKEPTPCILLYVKASTLKTIKVVDAIVMGNRIMHGRSGLSECAVVEVTMIR